MQLAIQNQRNYFKEIFAEVKKGNISRSDAIGMIDTFYRQSGRQIDIKFLQKDF